MRASVRALQYREEVAISVYRDGRATTNPEGAASGVQRADMESLAREELKRLIPDKLAEILLGLVARHPALMQDVATEVRRARKSSP